MSAGQYCGPARSPQIALLFIDWDTFQSVPIVHRTLSYLIRISCMFKISTLGLKLIVVPFGCESGPASARPRLKSMLEIKGTQACFGCSTYESSSESLRATDKRA